MCGRFLSIFPLWSAVSGRLRSCGQRPGGRPFRAIEAYASPAGTHASGSVGTQRDSADGQNGTIYQSVGRATVRGHSGAHPGFSQGGGRAEIIIYSDQKGAKNQPHFSSLLCCRLPWSSHIAKSYRTHAAYM